jgi:hypothetical protein
MLRLIQKKKGRVKFGWSDRKFSVWMIKQRNVEMRRLVMEMKVGKAKGRVVVMVMGLCLELLFG